MSILPYGRLHPLHPSFEATGADVLQRFLYIFEESADESISRELPELRKRSIDLCRNSIFGGVTGTMVTNVVGGGIRLQIELPFRKLGMSEQDAAEMEERAETLWKLHTESEDIDASRTKNIYGLQKTAAHNWFEAGDAISQLCSLTRQYSVSDLAINMIDPARVSNPFYRMDNPMFSGGIEKGTFGEPIRYHILAADSQFQNNWVPVSVFHDAGLRNICHIYTETRAGQSRGVPFITPVMKSFAHIHKYQEAELKAAAIAAFFAIMIKHAEAGGSTPGMEGVDIMSTLGTPQQNGPSVDVKMAPGQAVTLPQGYDFETIKSDRPNSGYGAFIDSKFREVAMGLEIPYEILIKTFGASYSASRGAMLEFWKLVKVFRALFNQRFNQHVFERFMFEMVAKGQIPIPRYLTDPYTRRLINMSAVWIGPPRGMIDEEKEARAAEKRINTGLTTLKEEIISMTGGDLNSKYTQMKAERRMKKELEAIDNEFQTAGVA